MKIAVIGPGAMGLLFAGFLKKSGEDVILIDKDEARAKSISKDGIKIEGISGNHNIAIHATSKPEEVSKADLIIICVKSYDTESAVKRISHHAKDTSTFLTLQNGIGNDGAISKSIDAKKILCGTTSQGATLLGIGHIRHAGNGETLIGPFSNQFDTKRLEEIISVFEKAGLETKISQEIKNVLWSKLIINVGINALTAITGLKNGALVEFSGTKAILKSAVEEAVEVVSKKGLKLVFDNPVDKVESVCQKTALNRSSMLQDVMNKKKTEIDYINGAVLKEAEALGLSSKVNKGLTDLVKSIEQSYR